LQIDGALFTPNFAKMGFFAKVTKLYSNRGVYYVTPYW